MSNMQQLSKFLSYMLRHNPAEFEVTLDAAGYTDYATVWAVVQRRYGKRFSEADLRRVLTEPASDGKQRFELVEGRVRALYGHNRQVRAVEYPPVEPPETLYHGTVAAALPHIRRDGLRGMARQYVHLSVYEERARTVAARRGHPVLLVVRARAAFTAGHSFYQPDDEHLLTEYVPPEFIVFPENE